ncbi:hypothetical protein D9611_000986 [Ephemerocybe angulata]|uniref:Uncharacterized protein n=1 Tax=Ephemerocybe angulata TaxID=980116 RepID=A0A8H5BN95_9AGAR|nr:hypothetical protein D9611_000986 [Tulosesus angulatus]
MMASGNTFKTPSFDTERRKVMTRHRRAVSVGDFESMAYTHYRSICLSCRISDEEGRPIQQCSEGCKNQTARSRQEATDLAISRVYKLANDLVAACKACMADHSKGKTARNELLIKFRLLVLEALHTPKENRTPMHNVTLAAAGTMPSLWNAQIPTFLLTPGSLPIEIFVDASVKGIGYTNGNQWAAWELTRGWRSEGRNIPWAEFVAVELGLRMLAADKTGGRIVRVRSDSTSVVEALSMKSMRETRWQDNAILKKILALCDEHRFAMAIEWVPTKENPADDPSRGVYGNWDNRAGPKIAIPVHLEHLVMDIEEPGFERFVRRAEPQRHRRTRSMYV